jgi:hypothetical protein
MLVVSGLLSVVKAKQLTTNDGLLTELFKIGHRSTQMLTD